MPGAIKLSGRTQIQSPHWQYLGEQTLTIDSTTIAAATLPSTATIFVVTFETQGGYFGINNPLPSAASGGYLPADVPVVFGPLSNLNSLSFIGNNAASTTVHLMYFKEVG